jgi:hypothetical protein
MMETENDVQNLKHQSADDPEEQFRVNNEPEKLDIIQQIEENDFSEPLNEGSAGDGVLKVLQENTDEVVRHETEGKIETKERTGNCEENNDSKQPVQSMKKHKSERDMSEQHSTIDQALVDRGMSEKSSSIIFAENQRKPPITLQHFICGRYDQSNPLDSLEEKVDLVKQILSSHENDLTLNESKRVEGGQY